jgi:hypothetical protein
VSVLLLPEPPFTTWRSARLGRRAKPLAEASEPQAQQYQRDAYQQGSYTDDPGDCADAAGGPEDHHRAAKGGDDADAAQEAPIRVVRGKTSRAQPLAAAEVGDQEAEQRNRQAQGRRGPEDQQSTDGQTDECCRQAVTRIGRSKRSDQTRDAIRQAIAADHHDQRAQAQARPEQGEQAKGDREYAAHQEPPPHMAQPFSGSGSDTPCGVA